MYQQEVRSVNKAQILKSETFAKIGLYFEITIENQDGVGLNFEKSGYNALIYVFLSFLF